MPYAVKTRQLLGITNANYWFEKIEFGGIMKWLLPFKTVVMSLVSVFRQSSPEIEIDNTQRVVGNRISKCTFTLLDLNGTEHQTG